MIKILVYIKHHFTFIWKAVEFVNSLLIKTLYSHRFNEIHKVFKNSSKDSKYVFRTLTIKDVEALHLLLNNQRKEYLSYFAPHNTDLKTIKSIIKSYNYLSFGCYDGNKLVGYFFLRLFFTRRAFIGRLVDENYQGQGIAKQMSIYLYNIADLIEFPIYSTINKNNIGSLNSHKSVRKYTIIKELKDDYLLIRFENKTHI